MPKPSARAVQLPESIDRALGRLRWRIRAYVCLQTAAVLLVWVGLTFWGALAIDYLPVLLGATEMPQTARVVLLAAMAVVALAILYRLFLRRIFVRLTDRSLAILIERRVPAFSDGLITTVELAADAEPNPTFRELISQTRTQADVRMQSTPLQGILNPRPLTWSLAVAGVLVVTIGTFYAFAAQAFDLGVKRIYLLGNEPWPRNARIEVVGFEVERPASGQSDIVATLRQFHGQSAKVAKGAAVRLLVRADATARMIPATCSIYYRTADGDRGRVNMTRVGQIRDGFQQYRYDGKPFKGILADTMFDVIGFDHRVAGYKLQVVDSPVVVSAAADCQFPAYLVDEQLGLWLPREVEVGAAVSLPKGTQFALRFTANKPLRHAIVRDTETGDEQQIPAQGDLVSLPVETLLANRSLELDLVDVDDVASEQPHRVYLAAIDDEPPKVQPRLRGIGMAVTPDVLMPVSGTVQDDYAVARVWYEVAINDQPPRELASANQRGGDLDDRLDFRDLRNRDANFRLAPDDRLLIGVKAADRHDLDGGPHVGEGDHYQLSVVTPDQLLTMLEAREFGLRQRLDQIISEMTQTRDAIQRIKSDGPVPASPAAPAAESADKSAGESATAAESDGQANDQQSPVERAWNLRSLRAQRAILQSEKSGQETMGVAVSFQDIRDELVNNRVDSADRKERLQRQIAEPLQQIAETMFAELGRRLTVLAGGLDDELPGLIASGVENEAVVARADECLAQANAVILALEAVREKMLDIEDFNQLLDRVRHLIAEQEQLLDETKKAQKKSVLDLLK